MKVDLVKLRATLAAADPGEVANHPLSVYSSDPVRFAVEVLGVHPWSRQAEVLQTVADHHRVAVRSGHKTGKSTLASVVALWWVCTRVGARAVLVAPTARQVRSILWRETRRLYRSALQPIGGECHDTPDRGLQFSDAREIIGLATDQPERIAGFSGANMLFVVDEASGVTEELFEAIAGNLAGGGRLLLTGNPTRTSGTFFDCWSRKSTFYTTRHISSLETPNATGNEAPIPGLATSEWCAEMAAEWGETSPLYEVRVLGEFPSQASNAVIALELVETSVARWRELNAAHVFESLGPLEIGLDPARFGDDASVAVARRGNMALEPYVWRGLDGIQLAERVLEVALSLRAANERPLVRVDVIGIGASVYDQLSRRSPQIRAMAVNVGEAASSANYARKRDELWFTLADWLKQGGAIPPDPKLEGELVAPTYTFLPSGKIQVESKDAMRARLKRSPDRADALGLAVYRPKGAGLSISSLMGYAAGVRRDSLTEGEDQWLRSQSSDGWCSRSNPKGR